MINQIKKNIVIRPKQTKATKGQATPSILATIPGIKPPLVNPGSGYPAGKLVDPLRGTPERPPREHAATSRPDFSPPTLAKILVDVDAYEGLMVFRFQEK